MLLSKTHDRIFDNVKTPFMQTASHSRIWAVDNQTICNHCKVINDLNGELYLSSKRQAACAPSGCDTKLKMTAHKFFQ